MKNYKVTIRDIKTNKEIAYTFVKNQSHIGAILKGKLKLKDAGVIYDRKKHDIGFCEV